MKILNPIRQSTNQSCLPACLLMLFYIGKNHQITEKEDQNLIIEGLLQFRDYYPLGILEAFVSRYKIPVEVLVDNIYFTKVLKSWVFSKSINIKNSPIRQNISHKLKSAFGPFIVFIDGFYLCRGPHTPHFVIVEKVLNQKIVIIDPWFGKRFYWSIEKLQESIASLKTHIRFCPISIELIIE